MLSCLLVFGVGAVAQTGPGQLLIYLQSEWEERSVAIGRRFVDADGDTIRLKKVSYYLSQLALLDEKGEWVELSGTYLYDLSDRRSGILRMDEVPAGNYQAIRFQVGLDSLAQAATDYQGALDPVKGMFWTWNTGYINAKLEGAIAQSGEPEREVTLHLGGYRQPFATAHEVVLITSIRIAEGKAGRMQIVTDLSEWLGENGLTDGEWKIMGPGKEAFEISRRVEDSFFVKIP